MAQLHPSALASVDLRAPEGALGRDLRDQLQQRGLAVDAAGAGSSLRAQVFSQLPSLDQAATEAELMSNRQDKSALPWVYLLPPANHRRKAPVRSAFEAILRAHGAVVTDDPELFVECLVLLAAFGCPVTPTSAIVAAEDSWLYLAAQALRARQSSLGKRPSHLVPEHKEPQATGAVFVDAASPPAGERRSRALIIPVAARSSAQRHRPQLLGLDLAIQAVELTGAAAERLAIGLGPAPEQPLLDVDTERFDRQLDKCTRRVGDHECKVLLSSYGVAITRQAVATTPSAASRIAKKAGYPVQMKPWGADQPSEPEGCPVHTEIMTAAEVRRSYAALCDEGDSEAVIIRETPPAGKELRVLIEYDDKAGLLLYVEQGSQRAPVAAMAPLRELDAQRLAQSVEASRADDPELDWPALAELLTRASHMVSASGRIQRLDLARVIVGPKNKGALVVDALAKLSD